MIKIKYMVAHKTAITFYLAGRELLAQTSQSNAVVAIRREGESRDAWVTRADEILREIVWAIDVDEVVDLAQHLTERGLA